MDIVGAQAHNNLQKGKYRHYYDCDEYRLYDIINMILEACKQTDLVHESISSIFKRVPLWTWAKQHTLQLNLNAL